jgi:hypothetical protein
MDDRKLLEAAAKAAGLAIDLDGHKWNPLADDGDRYRLARSCGLQIDFFQGIVCGRDYVVLGAWSPGNKENEARAIVRAAAANGRHQWMT